MNYTVIIVAGGKGTRMGADVPKQFLPIGGKPILMHTIEAFHRFDESIQKILVLPSDQHNYWQSLCEEFDFSIAHRVVSGGATRFHSVLQGLQYAEGNYIAVHDGVRPFVSQEVIKRCFKEVVLTHAVVPAISVVESLRQIGRAHV